MNGPKISVRQLAKELELSVATVSRALNDRADVAPDTRARVLSLAASRNYRKPGPVGAGEGADELSTSRTVALAYPGTPVSTAFGTFEPSLMAGILRGLEELRYSLAIVDLDHEREPGEHPTDMLRRKGLSGVLLRTLESESTLAERLAQSGIPVVLLAEHTEHPQLHYVHNESRTGSGRAVDHLVHLGHRRIGLVGHDRLDADLRERERGFFEGLSRNGLDADSAPVTRSVGATAEAGAQALERLLRLDEPPTAVYITNPVPTWGAMQRCLELGIRVPDELSIVGFDDSDMRFRLFPHCTSVCQDASMMGFEAARWLARRLEGLETEPLRVERSAVFSAHHSTGAAPRRPLRLAADFVTILRGST